MRHKFLVLIVKKLLKSVYIYGSHRKIKTGVSLFLDQSVCERFLNTGVSSTSGNRVYFFSERVVNRWNQLSRDDVDQTSVNGFKRVLERRRKERWTSSWTIVRQVPIVTSTLPTDDLPGVVWPHQVSRLSVCDVQVS